MSQLTQVEIEYALLAGRSYASNRKARQNWINEPVGWTQLEPKPPIRSEESPVSGFEAVAFKKGSTGEVVISFAGTNFSESMDLVADGILGLGFMQKQLVDAALFFKKVEAAVPQGTKITFTGHSLGGGLAALMGVFFNRDAVTFDPAPFRLTATKSNARLVADALRVAGIAADTALDSYATIERPVAEAIPDVAALVAAVAAVAGGRLGQAISTAYIQNKNYPTTIATESRVKAIALDGEILTSLVGNSSFERSALDRLKIKGGPQLNLANAGIGSISPVSVHSISMLIAVAVEPRLGTLPQQLPSLHRMFTEDALYGRDTSTRESNFFERLLQREFGGTAVGASGRGTGHLARFADDLTSLLGDTGVAQTQARDALVATAIEAYYFREGSITTPFFSFTEGRLSFDFGSLLDSGSEELDSVSEKLLNLVQSRAIPRLEQALSHLFSPAEQDYVRYLGGKTNWHIQQGASAMNFTASGQNNDVAIGGTGVDVINTGDGNDTLVGSVGSDVLDGGAGRDVLLGGADADFLTGGSGDDQLVGGAGQDTYYFNAGFGNDIIVDSDADGVIRYASQALPEGRKVGNNVWASADGQWTYVFSPSQAGSTLGRLSILRSGSNDSITIESYQRGGFGISLNDTPISPPAAQNQFTGDFVKAINPNNPEYYLMASGNYVPDPAAGSGAQADLIGGTVGSDEMRGGFGNDALAGFAGDDLIEGGAGSDYLEGGGGHDRLYGSTQSDTLFGDSGTDLVISRFGSHDRIADRIAVPITVRGWRRAAIERVALPLHAVNAPMRMPPEVRCIVRRPLTKEAA